jgi:hypothetical protein
MEFLIKRTNGEWFSLHNDHFNEVLRPQTIKAEPCAGWGDYRIKIPNGYISFSFEDPGLHIVFENYSGTRDEAVRIVHEIVEKIEAFSGEQGRIVDLGNRKTGK